MRNARAIVRDICKSSACGVFSGVNDVKRRASIPELSSRREVVNVFDGFGLPIASSTAFRLIAGRYFKSTLTDSRIKRHAPKI